VLRRGISGRYLPDARFKDATVNGKIYGVPSFAFVNWMYYRADWFKDAGLAPPKLLTSFRTRPSADRPVEEPLLASGMRGAGGGEGMVIEGHALVWLAHRRRQGPAAMDRQKATDALRWFTELFTKYKPCRRASPNDSFQQIMTGFTTGQTAMLCTTPAR